MQNASIGVKSKSIYEMMQIASMSFDDRPDAAVRLEKARIAAGFGSAREAALRYGWKYESYVQHENGTRGISRSAGRYAKAFKVSAAWLLTGEGGETSPEWRDFALLYDDLTPAEREDLKRHAQGLLALRKASAA